MKNGQRRVTPTRSSALCMFAAGAMVAVEIGDALTAHVLGVYRCGSPWSCPLCAPVIRQRRAEEIDTALGNAMARGMGAMFLTFTLRHHRGDGLAARLDVIAQSWHLVAQGRAWKAFAAKVGYVGVIKATENTWSPMNGWHPHSHLVMVTERPLTRDEQRELGVLLFGRWSAIVERRGFGTVTERRGVDVRPVTNEEQIGEYLNKLSVDPASSWSPGLELARSDVKRGRHQSSTPFDVFAEFMVTGDAALLALWLEYEKATIGKASVRFSPGLRRRLLGVEESESDVDLAASEGLDLALVRWMTGRRHWNAYMRAGLTADVLTNLEQVTSALLMCVRFFGHVPQPLDVPTEATNVDVQ